VTYSIKKNSRFSFSSYQIQLAAGLADIKYLTSWYSWDRLWRLFYP